MKKKVTLSIDEDLWERCRLLRRTAGANWSEVAEDAFSTVIDAFDQLSLARDASGLQSSGNTDAFAEDALAYLEVQYQTAIQKTNEALSGVKPVKPVSSSK